MKGIRRNLSLCVVCLLVLAAACGKADSAFLVDGQAVEKAEYIYYLQANVDKVAGLLEEAHDIHLFEEADWMVDIGGQTPLQYLKTYTVEEIARMKLEQRYAMEYGIETPISYAQQQEAYLRAVKERARRAQEGEIQYGADTLDFDTWFADIYFEMKTKLLDTLAETEAFAISETGLRSYYEDIKSQLPASYKSFEDSRRYLYNILLDQLYEEEIDRRLQEASIVYADMEVDIADIL